MDDPSIPATVSDVCLNCGHTLQGNYCGSCGQEAKELRRPFFRLGSETIQSLFELDGRTFRTLFRLITKPALLSCEYFSGRRASYTPPLRLFLVISVSFFLLVSLYTSIQSLEEVLRGDTAVSTAEPTDEIIATESRRNLRVNREKTSLENIQDVVSGINLPFFSEQTNENLRVAMIAQAEANLNSLMTDPGEFGANYLEYITLFMLLMIPLLALIQKVVYLGSGKYYIEHLVLALHNHAFLILAIFVNSVFEIIQERQLIFVSTFFSYAGTAVIIWIWLYLFLSLKNYFQQGYGITLLKFLTTTILYSITLSFGVLIFSGILFFLF